MTPTVLSSMPHTASTTYSIKTTSGLRCPTTCRRAARGRSGVTPSHVTWCTGRTCQWGCGMATGGTTCMDSTLGAPRSSTGCLSWSSRVYATSTLQDRRCDERDPNPKSSYRRCDERDPNPKSSYRRCDERDPNPKSSYRRCDERDPNPTHLIRHKLEAPP
jgi:hypothetical protein